MAGATVRRSPYKDFLQPALQRRFATASLFVLAIAYLQALLLANWSSLIWSWFPLGPTGVRAFSFFFCGILIIVLRISQYHPGVRTSDSGLHTFFRYAANVETPETLLVYTLSAFLFSVTYLWSLPGKSGLELITYFTADRARLNEKPLFLLSHLVLLGVYQSVLHLFKDSDRLSLGVARPQNGEGKLEEGDASFQVRRFRDMLPAILISTINQSIFGLLMSLVVYPLAVRGPIWKTAMVFLRPIYNLPRSNMVPSALPFSVSAILRCWLVSLMLLFAWTAANTAFSLFLVKSPLKNGKPLTSDSKDPNGSLLNGLKNKKLSIKCFAMWELAFIARDFSERRKAIYEDIDRKDGPMWSQVYKICLDTLKNMEASMDAYIAPPTPSGPATTEAAPEQKVRTTDPPRDEAIFQPIPQKKGLRNQVEKAVNQATLSPGQGSQLSPAAKKAVESAKQHLIKIQKDATGSDDTQGLIKDLALKVLHSPAGWPFRQHYRRRLTSAVLGAPYGEPSLYINAACALSGLAVHSLREDKYGNVQRDVAAIIRALTGVAKKLEGFGEGLPSHWTDVEGRRTCPEVDEVLGTLRDALGRLVEAFGPYARDLRLSLTDVRLAREAAGMVGVEGEVVEIGRGGR
ncbi:nucleoporin protein Ndc1-Nup [Chaetomidium leptoderma]|uniref:Nucleoporin protein Ndc1-Nup n=1 Tax=Chaetomidium leptoderma TaxID=669021 RepID=A0AAN6ZS09_9PEZI|nr:nucleoporin protein Ndc1-Nup [Chaetomidium leptoderma]